MTRRDSVPLPDVVAIELYERDVVVVRADGRAPKTDKERGCIKFWSRKSRQRLAFIAANTPIRLRTMITLTYPAQFPTDGAVVKHHLSRFLRFLRTDGRGCEYLWFLEWQMRGAPHVHILTDLPLTGTRDDRHNYRMRVGEQWYRIVGSGDYYHRLAGTSVEALRKVDGAARYALKYAAKMRQKWVPEGYTNVGRFWGCTPAVKPVPRGRVSLREDDLRALLEGWKYAPDEDVPIYRVLYGAAPSVEAAIRRIRGQT